MNTRLIQVIESFGVYLKELGYSKASCRALPCSVREFMSYHGKGFEAVDRDDIEAYYGWLQMRPNKRREGGLSEMSIVHQVFSLRVFFNWLEKTDQREGNPLSGFKVSRQKEGSREPLSEEEISGLFSCAVRLRDRAILHLFYSCGLRRREVVYLDIRDVHFKKRLLYVREGKGARRRVVPMPEKVAQELESYYLQERTKQKRVKDTSSFIVSQFGKRMSGSGYYGIFKTLLGSSGIERPVSLHHLRHSIATHLLQRGLRVEEVREFLGHRQLESTQVYVKVSSELLKGL